MGSGELEEDSAEVEASLTGCWRSNDRHGARWRGLRTTWENIRNPTQTRQVVIRVKVFWRLILGLRFPTLLLTSMSSEPSGRFAAYKRSLAAISARTGTPLPSLLLSFGILHELTAIVPLVGIFYGARSLGIGERVVSAIIEDQKNVPSSLEDGGISAFRSELGWAKQKMKTWVEEGDRWAIRIGRRYGMFGFEKRSPGEVDDIEKIASKASGHVIAGDVANAVFAYGMTKVCNLTGKNILSVSCYLYVFGVGYRHCSRFGLERLYICHPCFRGVLLNLYGRR